MNRIAFTAEQLEGEDDETIAILQEPLADGKIGKAVITGATVAKIEIIDEDHQYAAYSSNHPSYLKTVDSGEIKIVWKQSGTGTKWAVILLGAASQTSGGLRCNATLADDMAASNSTGTVDGIVCTDGGKFDESHPDYDSETGELTVYNTLSDSGSNNDACKIELNKHNNHWEFVRVKAFYDSDSGTEITIQTDTQWDGTNHKLQKKTRTAKVFDPGTESNWIDIDTATTCS